MLGHSHALTGIAGGLALGDALGWQPGKTAALAGFTAGMALLDSQISARKFDKIAISRAPR